MAIINTLIQKMDFEQIKIFDFLNARQQQFIVNFIFKSEEYKQFQALKGRRLNSPSSTANVPSQPATEKVPEKKKALPPRPAEKKE